MALTFMFASDPGLNRLRMAAAGATSVAAALAVEFGLARVLGATGPNVIIFMLFGGMVGMMGSNAFAERDISPNLRTAALFPVALGSGLLIGIAVNASHALTLATFVAVMFVAVYIRRFGLVFFFCGFLIWIGFFLAAFIHATLAGLPTMLLAAVVATAVVVLLCVTVFRPHPRRTLARVFRSIDSRSRQLAAACASLLESDADERERSATLRRITRVRAQIRDAVLMSDGWAAHAPALPSGWSAPALRRRLLETQLSLDRLVAATRAIADSPPQLRSSAVTVIRAYASGRDETAAYVIPHLTAVLQSPGLQCTETECSAARYIQSSIVDLTTAHPTPVSVSSPDESEYEPATNLPLGQLPGAPSVATDVAARGVRWNPLARLRLTTRQAIQVAVAGAIAIFAGSAINEQRYYWAVIATFVAFTGTGTRLDTARKATNRVLGTLIGLAAGIALANLTSGHTLWALVVVLGSIFCGFYLVRVSYAYMIFFVTIMVSQLYSILGEFTDQLLVLRLEETALGAVIGIAVALLVTPLSTRDTVTHAERELLNAMAAVLDAAADRHETPPKTSPAQVDQLMLAVDNSLRRLDLVAEPLIRYYVWERRPRNVRHRLAVLSGCVGATREIAARTQEDPSTNRTLIAACRRLAEETRLRGEPSAAAHLDPGTLPTMAETPESRPDTGARTQEFDRLHDLLEQLDTDRATQ